MAEIRIEHQALIEVVRTALEAEGVPGPVRDVEAELMAEADLLGVPSHGVRQLPGLIRAIRERRANPDPKLKMLRERAAICLLDGDNGPGRFVALRAMEHAISRAGRFGVAVCLASRTTHWGRAHAYASRAAQAGMIGLCTTNAIPNMVAPGCPNPLVANNPIAIAAPRGSGYDPIVLDMALSQAAVGKVGTYMREGWCAPQNWGLDREGRPTRDPAEIMASRRFLPMGEHKGVGLAIMMELLTAALCAGPFSHEIAVADSSALDPNASKLFIAIDIASFVDSGRFAARVEDLVEYLHGSAGEEIQILYPGERGWKTRDRYLKEGIPIHQEIAAQLQSVGVHIR